jgi:hypothetical protein
MNNKNEFIRIILFLIILITNMNAQDNNYWNQLPGARTAVFGGAVVGGVRDNRAVFYNPGVLVTNTVELISKPFHTIIKI